MKNSAFESFSESAQEALDFAKCQRSDGTIYGIPSGSECQTGRKVSGKQKADAVAPVPSRPIRDPVPGVLKRQEEHRQFLREESKRILQMYPGLKKAELKKKLEESVANIYSPATLKQELTNMQRRLDSLPSDATRQRRDLMLQMRDMARTVRTAQAMTPAEIEKGLKDAAAEMVKRDRANPGPLRGRTPITPTREMMGFPPIRRA